MGTRVLALAATSAAIALPLAAARPAAADPGCSGADASPAKERLGLVRHATLCLINRVRTEHGLRRLRANRRLRKGAMGHARDMVQRHYFAHTSLRARLATTGYATSRTAWTAGEALAWGTGSRASPRQIVQAWMNSPGHRQILLTGRFRDAGVGVARGAPGRARGGATYTLDLACRC
jgi:uncharacterized protein YkwD